MASNFNLDEAEFYRRVRKEKPLDKNLLNANIQLQDECRELKDIVKKARKYIEKVAVIDRKKLLNILNGKIE